MKCRQQQIAGERCAVLPERLVRAVVRAALLVAAQRSGGGRVAARGELLDELRCQGRQSPFMGVVPAFGKRGDKDSLYVIWHAC